MTSSTGRHWGEGASKDHRYTACTGYLYPKDGSPLYMERGDFHLSDKDNLYMRYIYDPSTRLRPSADPYWTSLDNGTNHFAILSETHVFSANAINDFRFAFNRTDRHTDIGPV